MQVMIIPVTPFQQNCTLMWCPETMEGAIIDPGGEIERLIGIVKEQDVNLVKILVTHGHIDHAGGVADLAERRDRTKTISSGSTAWPNKETVSAPVSWLSLSHPPTGLRAETSQHLATSHCKSAIARVTPPDM